MLDVVNAGGAGDPRGQPVDELRGSFAALCAVLGAGPVEAIAADDLPLGPVRARRYRRAGVGGDHASGVQPVLVWFHGGGWVIGSVDTHDGLCRELCARSGVTVVAVDYRLAPEHTFPTAHDDAVAAVSALFDRAAELGIDTGAVAVGGDSAGANLAAAVAAASVRGDVPPVQLQLLVYPVTDVRGTGAHPSRTGNGEGFLLTDATMRFFEATYVPDVGDRTHPLVSPLLAELAGQAPAVVVTAEFDPLRDEGDEYARALVAAGVPTEHRCVAGAIHLFLQMIDTAPARHELDLLAAALRSHLAG